MVTTAAHPMTKQEVSSALAAGPCMHCPNPYPVSMSGDDPKTGSFGNFKDLLRARGGEPEPEDPKDRGWTLETAAGRASNADDSDDAETARDRIMRRPAAFGPSLSISAQSRTKASTNPWLPLPSLETTRTSPFASSRCGRNSGGAPITRIGSCSLSWSLRKISFMTLAGSYGHRLAASTRPGAFLEGPSVD